MPLTADAELDAIAGHGRDHAAPWNAVGGIEHRLAGGHREVEKEVIVAGDEVDGGGDIGRGRIRLQQSRNQPFQEQGRRRDVAVVHLVAHVQRLRHQRFEIKSAKSLQSGLQASVRAPCPIHLRRSITSGLLAPKRSTRPIPSLKLLNA